MDIAAAHPSHVSRRPVVVAAFGASHRATAATGPVQSLKAFLSSLESEFDFKLLAKRNLGLEIAAGEPEGMASLRRWLNATPHDLIYLNSLFDREYTVPILMLRRAGQIPKRPVLISPRGELLANALSLKARRKKAYLAFAKIAALYDGVWLHATSLDEEARCRTMFPGSQRVVFAPELPPPTIPLPGTRQQDGTARLVFFARITPVKNVDFALRALALTKKRVSFDIYGPIQDAGYWQKCERMIAQLPANVSVSYRGVVPNAEFPRILSGCDVMFQPSLSENFGHSIYEAMVCGVPPLIGDQTPWQDLAREHAGWDLPLSDPEPFAQVIDSVASWTRQDRERFRAGAMVRAQSYKGTTDAIRSQNQAMIQQILAAGAS